MNVQKKKEKKKEEEVFNLKTQLLDISVSFG